MAGYPRGELLVEGDWLQAHLNDADLRIVDCDLPDAYRRVHIPSAVNPADHYYKNPDDRRFIMQPAQFAQAMADLGIGDDTLVIAYDAASTTAGRLWWCLNYYGHSNVRVLNGGWNQWLAEGRPMTMAVARPGASRPFTPAPGDESMRASAEYIMDHLDDPNVVIWDVRSQAEWDGSNTRGNKRQGHMPGAVHLEWTNNLTADELKRWKPEQELRDQLEACGITPEKQIITV